MIYQVGEQVPLAVYLTKNNGAPDNGKLLSVRVFDLDANNNALAETAMTESFAGYYKYQWTPSASLVNKTFLAFMYDAAGGTVYGSYRFRIVNTLQQTKDTIDFGDGKVS